MAHDHCCVNFCSNDKRNKSGENLSFFNFFSERLIEIETDRRYKARWRAGFRGKSRVVIFISDRLFLLIEDSASRFLSYDYWTGLNWQKIEVASLLLAGPQIFFILEICFVGGLYPPWSMKIAMFQTCKPSYSLLHILQLGVSRAHQSKAFLYLENSFKTANYNANKRGRIS